MEDKLEILAISLTNRCNLKCIYCGRNENEDNDKCRKLELSNEEWLRIFKDGKKLGLRSVNMTGGEIFIRNETIDLIEQTVALGIDVTLETNGTIINNAQIDRIAKIKDHVSMSISLDGIHESTNDLTRGKGAFKLAWETINKIKDKGIKLRIITVLSKNNYDEIPELAKTIHEDMKLGFRLLPTIVEYGRGIDANSSEGIPYNDVIKLMDEFYFDFLRKHPDDTNLNIELNFALMPPDIYRHNLCSWGKSMLGIGYDGTVALCHVSSDNEMFQFDNIRNTTLEEVWNKNKKLLKFKNFDANKLKGICNNCLAREFCRGGCRLYAMSKYNGDFYAPGPQCQNVYEIGKFPEYAMEDPEKDCSYQGE